MKTNIIYNQDCIGEKGMCILPDKSIDMILCDLPYGTTACKWDTIIPLESIWEQLKRVIKPNGAIVLTASQPFTTTLIASNVEMFKYEWIWEKTKGVGFLNARNAPLKFHENICVFSFGTIANKSYKRMKYNPQGLTLDGRIRNQPDICDSVGTRPSRNKPYIQKYRGYPTTILKFSNDGSKLHPTQKPVALMEYLIKTYTNEGEVVLDFAIGSGTTTVACKRLNRRYIGYETNKEYCNIAKARLEAEKTLWD